MTRSNIQTISKFSYSELEDFLAFAKKHVRIGPMRDFRKGGKYAILRQDVDRDISPSFEVAAIQKKLGIRSTFFVLLTSPTYNPQGQAVRKTLRGLADDGFEIGLHFDPQAYGRQTDRKLREIVRMECRALEFITGQRVESVALHNPSLLGKLPLFKDVINAHDKEVFAPERYLSDSMRIDPQIDAFRGKNPYEFVRTAKKFPIQIVLHPEQFLHGGGDYVDTIMRYSMKTTTEVMNDYINVLETVRGARQSKTK